jgi:hypothetical protein
MIATWEEEGGGLLIFWCCAQSARNIARNGSQHAHNICSIALIRTAEDWSDPHPMVTEAFDGSARIIRPGASGSEKQFSTLALGETDRTRAFPFSIHVPGVRRASHLVSNVAQAHRLGRNGAHPPVVPCLPACCSAAQRMGQVDPKLCTRVHVGPFFSNFSYQLNIISTYRVLIFIFLSQANII